jgi:formate dehydrogenase iron-sulfur subunit
MKKGKIVVDIDKCLACKTCEIECVISHSEIKNLFEIVKNPDRFPGVKIIEVKKLNIPERCEHCDFPACVVVCPAKALKKENGIVTIENEKCIGCGFCVVACPYGIPRINRERKIIIKCDLCFDRLKEDEYPACVIGCPTKAIKFIEVKK